MTVEERLAEAARLMTREERKQARETPEQTAARWLADLMEAATDYMAAGDRNALDAAKERITRRIVDLFGEVSTAQATLEANSFECDGRDCGVVFGEPASVGPHNPDDGLPAVHCYRCVEAESAAAAAAYIAIGNAARPIVERFEAFEKRGDSEGVLPTTWPDATMVGPQQRLGDYRALRKALNDAGER